MKQLYFLLLLSPSLLAQDYSQAKQKTSELLDTYIKVANIPGMSVAISIDAKIVYANSFGMADADKKVKANDSTKYRIGSVSKLLTATAFIELVEKGILKLDDPAGKYVKGLPASHATITLGQLAAHTSGIRHYKDAELKLMNSSEYSDLEEGLSKFISDSLLSRPGEKYSYSSYGYVLLGAAMENACDKKFNDIVKEYVLKPSGMHATVPELMALKQSNQSTFYYKGTKGFVPAEGENYSYKWPAGGYITTATDLAKFGAQLVSEKLVSSAFMPLILESQKTNDGKETGCSYGFKTAKDLRDRVIIHHGGESAGARTFLLIYPKEKLCIALCANLFRAALFEGEAETIAAYFLNDFVSKKNLVPSQEYNYMSSQYAKEFSGKFIVQKNKGVVMNFNNTDIPIMDIVEDKDKIRVIAASGSGLVNFWLTKDKTGFKGKWGYDKPLTAITIEQ